jgi:hypothetical protein
MSYDIGHMLLSVSTGTHFAILLNVQLPNMPINGEIKMQNELIFCDGDHETVSEAMTMSLATVIGNGRITTRALA